MTDADLQQYASDFRAAIIGNGESARMCAAISDPLSAALSVKGVTTTVMESDLEECNHVFLKLQDGRVLDPTADQFNWRSQRQLPGVYLGNATTIHWGAIERHEGRCWAPMLREFKRLAPEYSAQEVGFMVRMVLATLPAGLCELP